jgi:acetate kinase
VDAVSILVLNAGSSTLKFALFAGRSTETVAADTLEHPPADAVRNVAGAVREAAAADPILAVGHRVVHGGPRFTVSVAIDGAVIDEISRLSELAPLHNPAAVETIAEARRSFPGIPHVAVFDTSFFSDLPPRRHVYPLPYHWYAGHGIRRFGFHGINHAYCCARAAELLRRPEEGFRTVVCHLGNGCSATATIGGTPVATTMGFTPLEGLMMGTRAGSVDPGILLYAMGRLGLSASDLDRTLRHESGLLGVSGVSSDFREVRKAAREGNERARLALEIFADAVRAAVGALAAAAGGIDALVFTAGIGENAVELREEVCRGLGFLGLRFDAERNRSLRPDAVVSPEGPGGRVLVLRAREELQIARETLRVAGEGEGRGG